jgi:hypothetical protein
VLNHARDYSSRNMMRRTGRLLAPSMPVTNSAFPAAPAASVVAFSIEDGPDRGAADAAQGGGGKGEAQTITIVLCRYHY